MSRRSPRERTDLESALFSRLLEGYAKDVGGSAAPSFAAFANGWLERRCREGLRCRQGYRSILDKYLLPRFGLRSIDSITRKEHRDFGLWLLTQKTRYGRPLAPRYLRNIHRLFRKIMQDAVRDELLEHNPIIIDKGCGLLPKMVDADPAWRPGAVYSAEEVYVLITDTRIPEHIRIFLMMAFFTGGRVGEDGPLAWAHWLPGFKPLGKLIVAWSYNTTSTLR